MNVMYQMDRFFMRLAVEESAHSPDPSTRNGAVMVCEKQPRGGPAQYCADCNRYSVRGKSPSDDEVAYLNADRDRRLQWIEHAERNALFSAVARGLPTWGSTLYCPYAACTDCARAIVLLGVTRLVRLPASAFNGFPERWRTSIATGDAIMQAGGVQVEDYSGEALNREMWLDKQLWKV